MVALLVLLTFAVFIGIDILLNREKYAFRVKEAFPAEPALVPGPVVAGVRMPEQLYYHPGHTWAVPEGSHRLRVGIDEFAARLLGEITQVKTPTRGRWVAQGDRGWTLYAGARQATLPAPVEGEIVEINEDALAHPEKLSADPYRDGWLLVVRTTDPALNLRNLLNGKLARHWMEEAVAELKRLTSPGEAPVAADGGTLLPGIAQRVELERWETLARRFFLL